MLQRHPQPSGRVPLNCAWERYFAFDRAGALHVWTARTGSGVLSGYVVWLLLRGLHNKSTRFATADLFYLTPEWREGSRGYRFLRGAEAAVRKRFNPDLVRFETNCTYQEGRVRAIFERMGYPKIGEVFQR